MAKKTEKQTETETPLERSPEAAKESGPILLLPNVAGRIFGTPLAIQQTKLEIIMSALTPRFLGEMKFEGTRPIMRAQGAEDLIVSSGGIAVIQVHGTLVKRASFLDSMSGLVSYSSIEAQIQAALQAPEVSGILLSFDSPGGEVSGMVDAAEMIFQARDQKPIWALADDWAFSAAYSLASAAERVFVPITGEVGSVGVLAMHRDQSGRDEQMGLSFEYVFAGAQKIDGNPHEPLSDGARERLQQQVNATHMIFTDMVGKHRGITGDAVRALEAGTFQGQAAIEQGLADEIGSFRGVLAKFEASVRDETTSADVVGLEGKHPEGSLKVISLEDQRAKIRKEEEARARKAHAAYRKEVQELCRLAGHEQLASEYIERELSVDKVREALFDKRAAAADGQIVATHHAGEIPKSTKQTESTREIYARRQREALAHAENGGV